MDDEIYRLDRNGGRDKILKATYTPKSYRRKTAKADTFSGIKLFSVWIVILTVIFSVTYLAENLSITAFFQ